jgi:hypothetical protein
MAIIIRKQGQRNSLPAGHYFTKNGQEFLITGVNMNVKGNICIHAENPITFDKELLTVCSIEDLLALENLTYIKR